jgi:hypothetical protein
MNDIYEFYDSMSDISVATKDAIDSLKLAREKVQLALKMVNDTKKYGGKIAISPIPISITVNDVHRELLFFELLLNQTHGVTNTLTFQELLELTNYSINEDEF